MKAKTLSRLLSYIIDIILLSLIISPIYISLPQSSNIDNLNIELDNLNEQLLNQEISTNNYFNHYAEINYNYDKENILNTIVSTIFIIIYFIIMPYFTKGQTLGQKLMKIKVSKEKGNLSMNDLLVRSLIINGLGLTLISLLLIFILNPLGYLITTITLGIIQFILIIWCVVGIIKSQTGLHDKITNTSIINL